MGTRNSQLPTGVLGQLTRKQRDVLELLLEHKTSKEIARLLGVSPHTVDQRIQFAKRKLGVGNRSSLAVRYRELKEAYEQSLYEESHIPPPSDAAHDASQDDGSVLTDRDRIINQDMDSDRSDYRVVPELFDGRHGLWFRVGSVLIIAFLIIFLTLGSLAMYTALADILSQSPISSSAVN